MSNHTPGPWFHDCNGSIWRRSPDELYQNGGAVAGDKPLATVSKGWYHEGAEGYPVEENARLIAAAPDLLEALYETRKDLVVLRGNVADAAKTCSRLDGMPELIDAWIRRNDAAITKARGEA